MFPYDALFDIPRGLPTIGGFLVVIGVMTGWVQLLVFQALVRLFPWAPTKPPAHVATFRIPDPPPVPEVPPWRVTQLARYEMRMKKTTSAFVLFFVLHPNLLWMTGCTVFFLCAGLTLGTIVGESTNLYTVQVEVMDIELKKAAGRGDRIGCPELTEEWMRATRGSNFRVWFRILTAPPSIEAETMEESLFIGSTYQEEFDRFHTGQVWTVQMTRGGHLEPSTLRLISNP